MIKVNDGQDPYNVIGEYIREHMTAIEDMIAVIEIDGYITNELFMVDMDADGYFVWKSDWWEGEKNISLVDFFPVSDAKKTSAQRKGKWIYEKINSYTSRTYCSECGNSAPFRCVSDDHYGVHMHGEISKTKFCPNCGAKMDAEEGEAHEF